MARIIDKDTRLIDIDFGPLSVSMARSAAAEEPSSVTIGQNGEKQLLRLSGATKPDSGSFIQFVRIDLSHMTMNNEVMMPVDVNVQRTSPVPLGGMQNGASFNAIEEYIYVFSRPLNNEEISSGSTVFQNMRRLGLDRSALVTGSTNLGGEDAGIPTHEQTIYAEKRMYDFNQTRMATVANGGLIGGGALNEVAGDPQLTSVTTWGTLSAITGPNLYAYRVVYQRTQSFDGVPPPGYTNVGLDGFSSFEFPPVNITFLCKDPNYSEGEYLTRLANAMNSLPEGGPSA